MKQRITVEQLKEFIKDENEKVELVYEIINGEKPVDWYNRLPNFARTKDADTYEKWLEKYIIERLGQLYYDFSIKINIGKMIEILEKDHKITIDGNYDNGNWSVVLYRKESNNPSLDFHSHKKELCDALWEVVKEVLS